MDVLGASDDPALREAQELEDEDPVCRPLGAPRTWSN